MREEILNHIKQISNDIDTARILLDNEKYSDSVFHSEQAAEKALYLFKKHEIPVIHNLVRMARELKLKNGIIKAAQELTPDYLTTRYIDAANGIPAEMYDEESAQVHFDYALEIIRCVKKKLGI